MGRHTLKTRLIIVLLGLAAIPVLLLGGMQTWMSFGARTAEAEQIEASKAKALALQVSTYLGGFERELKVAVRLQGTSFPDPQASLPVLRRLIADRRTYREVAVMDEAGIETVSLSTARLIDPAARLDRSADDVFRVPAQTRDLYFGRVRFDAEDGEPLMDVAIPVIDPAARRVRAVLRAELRVRTLWDLAGAMTTEAGEEIYIVDEDSRVVASRNPSLVLAQRTAPTTGNLGINGEPVLSVRYPITVGGRKLAVIAEHTLTEASRPARETLRLSLLVTILAMAAAIALMAVAVRSVVGPIRTVALAARAVRNGDLSRQVPVRADDEIGELADTFNSMTAQLRTVLDALHDEIAVRTENEERFRGMFEQAAVGMALLDLDGRYLTVNERLCAILGYSAEELTQLTFQQVTLPDDLEHDVVRIEHLLRREIATYSREKRYRRKDGSVVWANVTASVVHAKTGEPRMFVSVVEDISARKEAETQLRATIDELSRSNLELERFAYVASHDLQEPLRNVIAFAQMLERRVGDDPEMLDPLHFIVSGAHRMRSLVQGLLDYSRAGNRQEPYAEVDLNRVVAEAQTNLQGAIAECGAEIVAQPLPTIVGDRMQMVQLLQNLIGNAIKFRHPDQAPVITISAQVRPGDIEVSVTDNGIGVSPEYHDQVFVIFKRLHRPDAYPGTGIGLAICRRIVERHGGQIWMEQQPAGGTAVRFTIPCQTETAALEVAL